MFETKSALRVASIVLKRVLASAMIFSKLSYCASSRLSIWMLNVAKSIMSNRMHKAPFSNAWRNCPHVQSRIGIKLYQILVVLNAA